MLFKIRAKNKTTRRIIISICLVSDFCRADFLQTLGTLQGPLDVAECIGALVCNIIVGIKKTRRGGMFEKDNYYVIQFSFILHYVYLLDNLVCP